MTFIKAKEQQVIALLVHSLFNLHSYQPEEKICTLENMVIKISPIQSQKHCNYDNCVIKVT